MTDNYTMNRKISLAKTAFAFCIGVFYMTSLCAQITFKTPSVIPPSPAVQNFLRYGEIPVDYSTGVPNINVPIYTARSRKLEVPISISYHASGIKVGDVASVVGLGWVLNAGGLVAKSIISQPDPGGYGPLSWSTADAFNSARNSVSQTIPPGYTSPIDWQNFGSLVDYEAAFKDWASDRYTFQLPDGESGVFRYDFHTGQLIKLPYSPVKIEKVVGTYMGFSNIVTSIKITDAKGIAYLFQLPAGGQVGTAITNWDLVSIISADRTDTIRLVYKSGENKYYTPSFTSVVKAGRFPVENASLNGPDFIAGAQMSTFASPSGLYTSERILDSIITSSTVVKVNVAADRQDMGVGFGSFRITSLVVYDRLSGNQVKEFDFNMSYFGASADHNQRLRLDALSVKGSDATTVETYHFDYNPLALPRAPEIGTYQIFSEDYWGYYNNAGASSLLPYQFVPTVVYPNGVGTSFQMPGQYIGNRDVDTLYAKAALIQDIRYPTGGKTVFDFGPNYAKAAYTYTNAAYQDGYVGGFRIRSIRNYTDEGKLASSKSYEYSPGHTRMIEYGLYGYDQRNFVNPNYNCHAQIDYTTQIITSSAFLPLTCDNGPPVFYDTVTEYDGDINGNAGKTVYTYEMPPTTTYTSYDEIRFQDPYEFDRGNYQPKLLSKTAYKNANNTYTPVAATVNTYTTALSGTQYFTGIHLVPTSDYPDDGAGFDYVETGIGTCDFAASLSHPLFFNMYDLHATQEINLLARTDQYDYNSDGNGYVLTSTDYTYDESTHFQVKQQKTANSKGDVIKTNFTYPIDYAGTSVYDNMVAGNNIASVIQQSKYNSKNNNDIFLQSITNNYYDWGNNLIALQTVDSRVLSNNPETRLRYYGYDASGNILSVGKENDLVKVYVWGYNNNYPVAEITGASYSNVIAILNQAILQNPSSDQALRDETQKIRQNFPSAFVTTYTYKPLVGMTSSTDPRGKTTYYEYDKFGRLSLVRDQDNNILKKYCYNYAGQPAGCPVLVGNTIKSGSFTSNSCTTGYVPAASVTYTVPAGSYFAVTQEAADGLAQTDVNTNGQAYANQHGVCVPGVPNDARSVTFTRNNCSAGQLGEQYTFTVDAGQFYGLTKTAANQLADTYIAANGQSYTNTHVYCLIPNTAIDANYYSQNCPSGQSPQPYHVVIPAGKYYDKIDGVANNMAIADAQAQANANGGCAPNIPTIYARFEIGITYPDLQEYGLYITFWSDAQMSTPANVPDGLSINIYQSGYDELWTNGSLDFHNTYSGNITQWGFTYPFSIMIDDIYSYDGEDDSTDSNGNTYVEKWKYDYTLQTISSPYVNIIMLPPLVPAHPPGF